MTDDTRKNKKKALYIITKSVWAGAGKYVYDLAKGLPSNEFEVFVAGGGKGALAQKLEKTGIPYFEIKHFQRDISLAGDILAFFEIIALLFKTRPDIVHVSSSKAGGLAGAAIFIYRIIALQATSYRLKAIFTAHGWAFAEKRSSAQIRLIKFASRLTCLFYNKVICVSEFDRELAIKNKITGKKKLTTIHNGIKIEEYPFLTKEKARAGIMNHESRIKNADGIWIGTIGEFTKNKGHTFLIDAISNLQSSIPSFRCILIGFGEEKEELESRIKNYELSDKIFLVENLENAPMCLKAFDIFVLPSLKEGLPYTLLEAGLAMLPVVASNVGGIPEIIKIPSTNSTSSLQTGSGQATGLLADPGNSEELKNKIEKIIENPALKSAMAYALWEKICQEFRFEQMLQKTTDVYLK